MLQKIIIVCLGIFLCSCEGNFSSFQIIKTPHKTTVGLQPYAQMDSAHVNEVKRALQLHYGFEIKILPNIAFPESSQTKNIPELAKLGFGNRYRADTLLRHLKLNIDKDCDYILGLTNQDISCTKRTDDKTTSKIKDPAWLYTDWGIFGLGYRPGKACIVSNHRLYRNTNETGMRGRLRKIAVHEVGHNLGLPHCPNTHCLMRDALEKMSTIDEEQEVLCNDCKNKIKGKIEKKG